jgi:hypothetical protein
MSLNMQRRLALILPRPLWLTRADFPFPLPLGEGEGEGGRA